MKYKFVITYIVNGEVLIRTQIK